MGVYRYRNGSFAEVATVGTSTDDATVKVRRTDSWEVVWPTSTGFVPVDTLATGTVTDTTATMRGTLATLEGASEADVWFRYRLVGEEPPVDTTTQTVAETGEFTASADGLLSGRTYDAWALARLGGATYAGRIRTFTTP